MSSIIRNALALSVVAAVALAQQDATSPRLDAACADAVIVMARGNNAPYHDSRTFPFVDATCDKIKAEGKTCDYLEVEFPTMQNGDYCTQIATGVRNGQAMITAFNKKCPCTHLILNGFSQGAWITGDMLAGPGGCSQITTGFDSTSAPGNAIAAALLWGDVMHIKNMPYNAKSSENLAEGAALQKNGRSADSLARLNQRYSPILRSYCGMGDPICADGDNVEIHLNYFELYTDDASTWAVGKLNEAAPLCATPTPTPSASPSVVSSSVEAASATVDATASSSPVATPSSSPVAAAPSSAASPSKSAPLPPYPTSPVNITPFPAPQPWNPTCIPIMQIEYVYA